LYKIIVSQNKYIDLKEALEQWALRRDYLKQTALFSALHERVA